MTIPGAGIVQKLVDFALHPVLSELTPCLDSYGPYEGNTQLEKWYGGPGPVKSEQFVSASSGVLVTLNGAVPPEWGYRVGWVSAGGEVDAAEYVPPLGQVVVLHQLRTGLWVVTQIEAVTRVPLVLMWNVAVPGQLGLLVAPGVKFDLYFLCVG